MPIVNKFVLVVFLSLMFSCKENKNSKSPKNVLLICIDDLRPELNSFGANYIKSPNIDELASRGRAFLKHYVNSPSCGPSRFTLLTGQYGTQYRRHHNQQLFSRAKALNENQDIMSFSMPAWFRKNGYTTVSVGKVSHHPGGRGGELWNSDSIPEMPEAWDKHLMPVGDWQHPKGAMHGLAHGKIRTPNQRKVVEAIDGGDEIYPDGLIVHEGIKQLEELAAKDKPFFLAIGLIKPHLPFGAPKKYLDLYENTEIPSVPHPEKPSENSSWSGSGEFMNYDRGGRDPRNDKDFAMEIKKYYAACVSYADKHVGDILSKLKETGADKNTIVVLWGDHGWHLGEHAVWGKHTLYEESLHAPLIIYDPEIIKKGEKTNAMVETIDVFPTLCDLINQPKPDYLHGSSLLPIIKDVNAEGHPVAGYFSTSSTIRTDRHRLTVNGNGLVELYDHESKEKETKNIAKENPDLVTELRGLLQDKLGEFAFDWDP
ncbi:sulfatase [Seonamhaeicola sp. MEBiC1930]|uniref:sulfatase n=1 Tax=Seonamhaeicola sp. MEBiC01930 TaxID=2976768 RepID=UPI0032448D2A